MNKEELKEEVRRTGQFSFARSGGPGGQNVNKVNTKVLLTIVIDDLYSLTPSEKERLRIKLSSRFNARGELFIQIQEERSQLLNREIAVEKLCEIIEKALFVPKKRKKTRPTAASRRRRLDGKKKQGEKKKNRGPVSYSD